MDLPDRTRKAKLLRRYATIHGKHQAGNPLFVTRARCLTAHDNVHSLDARNVHESPRLSHANTSHRLSGLAGGYFESGESTTLVNTELKHLFREWELGRRWKRSFPLICLQANLLRSAKGAGNPRKVGCHSRFTLVLTEGESYLPG